jgi:hypothetical protein
VSGIQAARAATFLRKELGVDPVVVEGRYGELSVEVDGEKVIDAGALAFLGVLPSLRRIRDAVAAKLDAESGASTSAREADA